MERFKVLFLIGAIAGAIYFVKSIKISVSGAEAMVEDSFDEATEDEIPADEDMASLIDSDDASERDPASESPQLNDKYSQMVKLIRGQKLCEFIELTKTKGISRRDQYKALSSTLPGEGFKELEVFAGGDFDTFDDYKTIMAKTYILAKKLNAFESWDFKIGNDFEKGISKEHQEVLEKIETLQGMDPSNLMYSFFRNDIYLHYKNLDNDIKAKLFDKVMANSRYINPVHDLARDLYSQVKNNVVQFYLAQGIFEQPLSIENSMISRTVWRVYDEGMRDHITTILQRKVESANDSSKVFGYESGLYTAYRNILPFDVYEVTPELHFFESTRNQPTYPLSELKPDLGVACDAGKVNDLTIKLRSL